MRQMVNAAIGETRDQLLVAARKAGFSMKTRLSRWHRAGVIPRPERRFLGRLLGSSSVYPPGTTKLLLAACTMHSREPRLPLQELVWKLWWEGHDVLTQQIRVSLRQIAKIWELRIRGLVKNGELTRAGRIFQQEASNKRAPNKLVGGMRKRVGRRKFPAFIRLVLEILSGEFYYFSDDEDARIIERSLGGTAKVGGESVAGGPHFPLETPGSVRKIFDRFHAGVFKDSLNAASDEDLKRTREEIRTFLEVLGRFGMVSSRRAPLLMRFQEFEVDQPLIQAMFVMLWLVRSDGVPKQVLDSLQLLSTRPTIHQVFAPIRISTGKQGPVGSRAGAYALVKKG